MRLLLALLALLQLPFQDRTHSSRVFGQPRHYRLFLPASYETAAKRYPVIYYFHGHSDRYTLEKYDDGTDTVPKIRDFVARNDAIVVAVDGYVPEHYNGFYGGAPWDVMEDGGAWDFGEYFQELVSHIDSTLRTIPDRRHRAVSGLSMGGFMSLYLSARYPHLIGSASAFNPGPEFYTGEKGRRVLWRPKDHVAAHTRTMVRLVRASGDYISQYHEETREAYARASDVDFEFRQDEYHRHWATSIAETFAFHLRAFTNPALDTVPESFNYSNAHRSFNAWGYQVTSEGGDAGFTYLSGVGQGGMRITTRRWAPDGPPVAARRISILTPPLYKAGHPYLLLARPLTGGATVQRTSNADAAGRLRIDVDGSGHQVSIVGPGTGAQPPLLLPTTTKDVLRVRPGRETALPIRIWNPRGAPLGDIRVELSTEYPTVRLLAKSTAIESIAPGATADLSSRFQAVFTGGGNDFAPARISLKLTYDGWLSRTEDVDVLTVPDDLPTPLAIEVLDGRTMKFPVFRQKGNQGGGGPLERTVTEGKGNGNGVLEPGEEATVWVKLARGLDPFDRGNWYRAKVYTDSPWLEEIADIAEPKQREWTGAKERTSLVRLAPDIPRDVAIPVILANESWSFHYTPDVRYGRERLYQAFQLHRRHLHRYEFPVVNRARGATAK
jgi:enterochelin esterase-like enzyme